MNFQDLPHIAQLQKDLWAWPKSRAAVMVGAGFSLNAEPLPGVTKHFPTWKQLVRVMFDDLNPPELGETLEQAKAREGRFNSAAALRIASEYETAFDRSKLDQLIRAQNPDSDHQPGALHKQLLELPWVDVFTTNYDTLLERTEIPGRTYQPVIKPAELTTAFAPRIVKLHGSFPSQTPFIISEEDYRTYPRKFAPFVNTVQQSLLENCFVLIGFSGDDPNFLAWTGWIRDELGGNHAPIYLVGPLSLRNAERSLLAHRGITPIDLSPIFDRIARSRGIHVASIEWFLKSLAAARPSRPESWPSFESGIDTVGGCEPPLAAGKAAIPDPADRFINPTTGLNPAVIAKVISRWKYERLTYPGWTVAKEELRSSIWASTQHLILPIINFAKDWPVADRLFLYEFLLRTTVATMDPALAERLYNWCLNIFERELALFSGSFVINSAEEALFELLPEVLSRLAFKVKAEYLKKAFPLVLRFHALPAIRRHIRLHQSTEPWFRRLFEAADGSLLLEWLPELIKAPLFDDGISSFRGPEDVWPDPMQHFPTDRGREAHRGQTGLIQKINEATEWLLRRAASESAEGRSRALMRLADVYFIKVMTPVQEKQFGQLLWSQRSKSGLPDLPHIAVFGLLILPAPEGTDVKEAIKQYILNLPVRNAVVIGDPGRITINGSLVEQPLIREAASASKPIVQRPGEKFEGVEWTSSESRQLYEKARSWWENDKRAFNLPNQPNAFSHLALGSRKTYLSRIGTFLARAVLPHMDWADEEAWQSLLAWLFEFRQLGVYLTEALPYVLIKRPAEATAALATIQNDLDSEVEGSVGAAANAVRHWIHLAGLGSIPECSSKLVMALVERVAFRRKTDILLCLGHLTYIILEKSNAINSTQIDLLSASLLPWNYATILPVPEGDAGDFSEAERPELRVFLGGLAGAISIWAQKASAGMPETNGITFWRDACAADPLPEVRRAFTAWDHLSL